MSGGILEEIAASTRRRVAREKERVPEAALRSRVAEAREPLDFAGALAEEGLRVIAERGPCAGIRCGFPMPMDWPEQELALEKREVKGAIRGITLKELDGGVRQARFYVSRLGRGDTAELTYTLTVKRRSLAPPGDVSALSIPTEPEAKLRPFLNSSPLIETEHPKVQAAAESLRLPSGNAWEQVAAIRRFTEARVKYSGVKKLEGALRGLVDGSGDCEERTSVFVAMCRLKGIPARSIWRPGHAYAEFYLVDDRGAGFWFPAESVGGRFGYMGDDFLILQKGDRFRDPLKRGVQRYLTETAAGNLRPGAAAPRIEPVRELLNEDGSTTVLH